MLGDHMSEEDFTATARFAVWELMPFVVLSGSTWKCLRFDSCQERIRESTKVREFHIVGKLSLRKCLKLFVLSNKKERGVQCGFLFVLLFMQTLIYLAKSRMT